MSVVPSLKNINSIANCKLISKIDKRWTIIYEIQIKGGWDLEICHIFANSTVLKQ